MDLTGLCDLMDKLARQTWTDLTEAAEHRLPLDEESITQPLLIKLAKQARRDQPDYSLHHRTLSKVVESREGADFELWLELPWGSAVGWTIQAKRASQTRPAMYEHVDYRTKSADEKQYDRLVAHALEYRAMPLHLFYNGESCRDAGFRALPDVTLYGCAVVDTDLVRLIAETPAPDRHHSPKLVENYAPHSRPWSSLFRWPRDGGWWSSNGTEPPGLGDPVRAGIRDRGQAIWEEWVQNFPVVAPGLPSYVSEMLGGAQIDDPTLPEAVIVIGEPRG